MSPTPAESQTRPMPHTRPGPRLEVPGLLAVACAAGLVLCLAWFPLASIDLGYHLAYGRHFLDTGIIVGFQPDPILRAEYAVPFVNANWLSQVVFAVVERTAGMAGLIGLRLTLLSIIFAGVAVVARRHGGGAVAIAGATALAALAGYERFSLRPELFAYAVLAMQLAILSSGALRRRSVIALALLQVALVNLHSYFLLGLLLTAAFAAPAMLAALLKRRIAQDRAAPDRAGRRAPSTGGMPERSAGMRGAYPRAKLLAIALALQAVACVVNPWHVRGAIFPLKTLAFLRAHDVMGGATATAASAWSEISEFRSPFSFLGEPVCRFTIDAYLGMLVVCGAGLIALLARRQFASAIVVAILFGTTLQMRRNIAPFALLCTPMALGALSGWAASAMQTRRCRFWRSALSIAIALACLAIAWTVYDGRFYYAERRLARRFGAGYAANAFTMDAARWLAAHDEVQPALFVDYFSSSNLLPWLPPRFKLLCNTNTFAVRDEALRLSFDLVQGLEPHGEAFDRLGINAVLLRCSSNTQALVQALARDDMTWALVHLDRQSVVFVRRTPAHVDLIVASEIRPGEFDTTRWIDAADAGNDAEHGAPTGAAGESSRLIRALDLYTQANVPLFLGWYDQAAEHLKAAVELAPDHAESWNNLGLCHARLMNQRVRAGEFDAAMGHLAEAQRCFELALKLSPENAAAAENLKRLKAAVQE